MTDLSPTDFLLVRSFWDAYFENRFVNLSRGLAGCVGTARTTPAGGPEGLFKGPTVQEMICPRELLRAYDTARDARFFLLARPAPNAVDALQSMIDGSYRYRTPAPFGKARMTELLKRCADMIGGPASTATLQELLTSLVAVGDGSLDAEIAALAFLLGELRDPSSALALLTVMRNAPGVPFAKRVIHFSAVSAAFSGAWKCDAKAIAPDLLELMEEADSSARQRIASLFERLYSTAESISLDLHGESWLSPVFWRERLAPFADPATWPVLRASSLFWELRLQAVSLLGHCDHDLLRALANDEVGVVRSAAIDRLAGTAGAMASGSLA